MRTETLGRINPETSPQNRTQVSLGPNPDFFGPQWARLERDKITQLTPEGGFSSVKLLESPSISPKVDTSKLTEMAVVGVPTVEEVKRSLSYNPGRHKRSYVDDMGRRIVRVSRGSRCLMDKPHHPEGCKGRAHIRTDTPKDDTPKEAQPASATDRYKSNQKVKTKPSQNQRYRSRLRIGPRRIKS